jgi:hypothetical protein
MMPRMILGHGGRSLLPWMCLVFGCGEADPIDEPIAGRCAWSAKPLVAEVLVGPSVALGDVTGDGIDDWLARIPSGRRVIAGPLPGTEHAVVIDPEPDGEFYATTATGDVDQDGARDLVIARPWRGEVAVFFGPITTGPLDLDAPSLAIRSPQDGLADLFGRAMVIADVTGDGAADLVIGAPAEGEEACAGTRDIGVWPGPLTAGSTTLDSAPVRIAAPQSTCLGNALTVFDNELVVAGDTEVQFFALPLGDAPVRAVTGRYATGAGDLDGDALVDLAFESGEVAFGNGLRGQLELDPQRHLYVSAPLPWLRNDVSFVAVANEPQLRLLDGTQTTLAELPLVATEVIEGTISLADVDADGTPDVIAGPYALRCR